jgi:hypothetical protein
MFLKTVFIGYVVILFCGVVFQKFRYLSPSPSETSSTYDFSLGPSLVTIPVTIIKGSRIVDNCDMFFGATFIGDCVTYVFKCLNSLLLSKFLVLLYNQTNCKNLSSLTVS